MNFKELQSFFSGKSSLEGKKYLLGLFQNSNGLEMLENAFKEGWNQSANGRIHSWKPDLCFRKILEKIKLDHDTIYDNDY